MTWYRLVVAGRDLAPQRERRLAERRIPGAARSREVLARSRVVLRGRATGRRDHRLATVQRLGDVEVRAVEVRDRGVDELLVPVLERVDAVDRPVRVDVEV